MNRTIKALFKTFAPMLVKSLATKMDGKKTFAGLILTAGGAGLSFIPEMQKVGNGLLLTGIPTMVGGITHKIIKFKKQKEN